jgi:short-subunit dehydrogenase
MMRATCQDLMGSGVHTALVCPGFTDTEMLRAHVGQNRHSRSLARRVTLAASSGRWKWRAPSCSVPRTR